jgi:hypothetical protein
MATKEQIDKRVATRQARLETLQPKLTVLEEKVAKFDERQAELRKKLTDRRDRTAKRVRTLTAEIEWFKAAPVNGVEDTETDEPADIDTDAAEVDDTEPGEASDLPDESDDDETDDDETDPAEGTEHAVRGPGGRFVSANA